MASGDTKTQQYLDIAARGTRADLQRGCCNTRTQDLIMDVAERIITEEETRYREDQILQSEIDEIKNNPDVYDIVATYADLQNYDTSTITDKDVIRVLRDETHDNASTYYRWDAADQEFDYVGETGDYYTKAQVNALLALKADKATTYTKTETDALLDGKQDVLTAGENITIEDESGSLVISATDTTYSDFTGTDGTSAGEAGLVPAPATTDAGKFLKADGTWGTAGGGSGPTVVQSTGTSTTDVMSQNAVTSMVFADPSEKANIRIGNTGSMTGSVDYTVAIGKMAVADAGTAASLGYYARARGIGAIALGREAQTTIGNRGSIALGSYSNATQVGEMNIGSSVTTHGYNNSNYRRLSGVYDPQSAHDAATKGYVDAITLTNAGAPTTSTVGTVGQLLEDTTNGKLYICTDTTGGTYTWEEVGAGGGGGPTVVQTTGTSQTDVMSQNAVTSMVYADPSTKSKVNIGNGSNAVGDNALAIGRGAQVNNANSSVALGFNANVGPAHYWSVALGANSSTTSNGEVSFGGPGVSGLGYNNSNYRLLTNVYDPQSAHDAATKGYVDPTTDSSAPTTATVGRLGQIQIDTTNADAYMCVAVDDVTPSYTWKQITA